MLRIKSKIFRVGIVGAGLIGNKRAIALKKVGGSKLVAVADVDAKRSAAFGEKYGCEVSKSWQELVRRRDIDVAIIAVPNKFTAPIAIAALKYGKHILCEKPFGRNAKEAQKILTAGKEYHRMIKVGFSNRFHPGVWRAKQEFDRGIIGKILFIRARHGHGGRVGMEKEWRLNKKIAGGGELLDQGVHIIDLCRWFAGEFGEVYGSVDTKYWKTDVEDNAFAIMKSKKGATAAFHVSTTNWGNIFSFEVFGNKGVITVEGFGGNYGTETFKVGISFPPYGNLRTKTFTYPPQVDTSWENEWKNFLAGIEKKGKLVGDARDGLAANQIVEAIYKASRMGRAVKV